MVEAGADQIPEARLLEALDLAQQEIVKLCEAQERLRAAGRQAEVARRRRHRGDRRPLRRGDRQPPRASTACTRAPRSPARSSSARPAGSRWSRPSTTSSASSRCGCRSPRCSRRSAPTVVEGPVREQFENDLRALTEAEQDSKELKSAKQHLLYERIIDSVHLPFPIGPDTAGDAVVKDSLTKHYVKKAAEAIYKDLVRKKIAVDKRRPDGRSETEIRAITCEVTVSPRTHGSGLFTRGQTQIMSLLTLGTAKEGQRIDDLSLEKDRRFMHHYNFPPFSVGETGRMTGPRRRDIGHGALAQRALEASLPDTADFPYTIRIVSETLESNGSSSMGSVCGSTLALMDAGVPIKAPVSGIAMGLVKEGDDYVILTDIQGAEDHLGDMDFKVAGTRDGITALQMDIKITGVSREIMEQALAQAKEARVAILDRMLEAIGAAAHGARRPRAADLDRPDQPRVHRHGHRQGRRDDPLARGRVRGADRHRGGRHDPRLRHRGHEGRRRDRSDHGADQGPGGRRRVHRQGREDHRLRRVRRAEEGHRRPAPRLERRPGPREPHRGRPRPRRRRRGRRAGGRQGPRPHRPQADPEARGRQDRLARGARRAGEERPAARAARGAPARATTGGRGGSRGGPRRDREGASSE